MFSIWDDMILCTENSEEPTQAHTYTHTHTHTHNVEFETKKQNLIVRKIFSAHHKQMIAFYGRQV